MMALFTENKIVLIVGVVLAGLFLGVNNTLITETVMISAPVERSTASAAYSFVRFVGGAAAPWVAGKLGESNVHMPFWVARCSPSPPYSSCRADVRFSLTSTTTIPRRTASTKHSPSP